MRMPNYGVLLSTNDSKHRLEIQDTVDESGVKP